MAQSAATAPPPRTATLFPGDASAARVGQKVPPGQGAFLARDPSRTGSVNPAQTTTASNMPNRASRGRALDIGVEDPVDGAQLADEIEVAAHDVLVKPEVRDQRSSSLPPLLLLERS